MRKFNILLAAVIATLCISSMFMGCNGGGGSSDGANAAGGHSVVTAVKNSAPLNVCPTGGIEVDAGIDTNANAALDASEITSVQYVCNGTNGSNGITTLVSVVSEPSGTNCPTGGEKVSVGPDTNGNGVLDTPEMTSSDYICNGAAGGNGADGTSGTNGFTTLVSIVTEPSGTYCPHGGTKISSGLDANRNEVLDANEVASTNYVCSGSTGSTGPSGLGVTWVDVTGTSIQAESNKGYMADNESQVTITLPASPAVGDIVQVSGIAAGGWNVAQNAGQTIITRDLGPYIGVTWKAHESTRSWYPVASSADGMKLIAAEQNGRIYTSTDGGSTWTPRESSRNWASLASSADGVKLVSAASGSRIYTSTDSGVTWTPRNADRNWASVTSSSDGVKLAAVEWGGQIYTSSDSGATWTPQETNRNWLAIASSADGVKLAALEFGGQIYTSWDSGATWIPREMNRNWRSIAMSSDGKRLAAVVPNGQIYTSTDSGTTWTPRETNRGWTSIASSSDGTVLAATVVGSIYISIDGGVTWTARQAVGTWWSIACSSDGRNLVAAENGGQLYTSVPEVIQSTTSGTSGSISGAQYDAIELQYIGNGTFIILSHEGSLVVR